MEAEFLGSLIRDYPYWVVFFAIAPGVVGFAGLLVGYLKGNKIYG
jgi:hypothetical protein